MLVWFEKHKKVSIAITVIIALAIFYISSLSFVPGKSTGSMNSVFYHFLAFFWFSFFLSISLISGKKKLFSIALSVALIYAISDEIHQLFVPYRCCSLSDILTDSAGILLANFAYLIRLKKKIMRSSKLF